MKRPGVPPLPTAPVVREEHKGRLPLKLTALVFTMCVTITGVVYTFLYKDTTIVIVGMGIIGGVIGANAVCDFKDRDNGSGHLRVS